MMNSENSTGEYYISDCAGDSIKIVSKDEKISRFLTNHNYIFEPLPEVYKDVFSDLSGRYFVKKITKLSEKAKELIFLRDEGIPFACGKEWSPQEVFEYLRDGEYVQGMYDAIDWKGGIGIISSR